MCAGCLGLKEANRPFPVLKNTCDWTLAENQPGNDMVDFAETFEMIAFNCSIFLCFQATSPSPTPSPHSSTSHFDTHFNISEFSANGVSFFLSLSFFLFLSFSSARVFLEESSEVLSSWREMAVYLWVAADVNQFGSLIFISLKLFSRDQFIFCAIPPLSSVIFSLPEMSDWLLVDLGKKLAFSQSLISRCLNHRDLRRERRWNQAFLVNCRVVKRFIGHPAIFALGRSTRSWQWKNTRFSLNHHPNRRGKRRIENRQRKMKKQRRGITKLVGAKYHINDAEGRRAIGSDLCDTRRCFSFSPPFAFPSSRTESEN